LQIPFDKPRYPPVASNEIIDLVQRFLESLIHTCRLCDVNPFDYLNALQHHAQDVIAAPARWLPWNFRERPVADP
jgi:hypothetical protein